jgi:hypothetical protein
MKSLTLNVVFFLLIKVCAAQTTTLNPELNKFVGVWRWVNSTDTLEITLQKQIYINYLVNTQEEMLVGWHRYVKNGVLQQSSYPYISRNINIDFDDNSLDFKNTLFGTVYNTKPNEVFFITLWDLVLHKNFELWFTLLPNSTNQAVWKLTQGRGGLYAGPHGLNGVYSLPKEIILNKL